MNAYVILIISILSEVFGSSMLKLTNGFKKVLPTLGVVAGYGVAFYGLSLALKYIELGTAYAIWSGLGTALTALVGVFVYKESFNRRTLLGLLLIIGGVVLLNIGETY
ncbi:DMT family transporter [Ornithinibacillus halotolerans]|uniref:QacE family quaternary ammonium compound efflux SMR transporter n=1 Tax=Ornithinibacillus halotolerans TaxID=1274357 RepID=A0A916S2C6_9BACI|nr:multidrug efflux SMR transporter [Ornithinibacillus halotolerans]GGA80366.1 QacE family quaternary ammonium compound efflux SMR transporter [Ornithinibacillus halotolerans]